MRNLQTVQSIDGLLPQTQCGRCGFADCRAYAEALGAGQAYLNRCAPGGESTIDALAALLGLQPRLLDPACGDPVPRRVVRIEERWCLGCARCLAVCPVDAILGAPGQMHTVMTEECTGCERCVAQCPVDCIQRVAAEPVPLSAVPSAAVAPADGAAVGSRGWPGGWSGRQADRARARYQARQSRLTKKQLKRAADHERRRAMIRPDDKQRPSPQETIGTMLARARARRWHV